MLSRAISNLSSSRSSILGTLVCRGIRHEKDYITMTTSPRCGRIRCRPRYDWRGDGQMTDSFDATDWGLMVQDHSHPLMNLWKGAPF
eukprot:scaffold1318_cov388-Prasinococcus_capsulatus_cf.AAC.92